MVLLLRNPASKQDFLNLYKVVLNKADLGLGENEWEGRMEGLRSKKCGMTFEGMQERIC